MYIDTKYGGVAFLNGYDSILTFWRSGKSYLHLGVWSFKFGKSEDPHYYSYGCGPLFVYRIEK